VPSPDGPQSRRVGGGDLLRPWAIVVGALLLGVTAWVVLAPAHVYRELGPAGRRASCGSVVQPLEPYASHDEVCFDALYARRHVAPVIGVAGALLVLVPTVGRRLKRAWRRRTDSDPYASDEEARRMKALEAQSFHSLRARLSRRSG
jgi:hypothetical protein